MVTLMPPSGQMHVVALCFVLQAMFVDFGMAVHIILLAVMLLTLPDASSVQLHVVALCFIIAAICRLWHGGGAEPAATFALLNSGQGNPT
jgi:hypothetical protein